MFESWFRIRSWENAVYKWFGVKYFRFFVVKKTYALAIYRLIRRLVPLFVISSDRPIGVSHRDCLVIDSILVEKMHLILLIPVVLFCLAGELFHNILPFNSLKLLVSASLFTAYAVAFQRYLRGRWLAC